MSKLLFADELSTVPFLGTEEKYWRRYYENRFLELSYRVMKKAGIDKMIIDNHVVSGEKLPIIATTSAHGMTILLELNKDA